MNSVAGALALIATLPLMTSMVVVARADETPSAAVISAGEEFVDSLVQSNFSGAVVKFDPKMKDALPEQKLQDIWQALQQQAGPFKKRLRARIEKTGTYDVVFVTCQFGRADLDVKVVCDTDQRIAGLFFVPGQPAADSFPPPPYANPSAFEEKDFTVGSGEWSLPGTLTLPVKANHPLPAVVLVHGSGPNDRDETILANKPFRDLAWGLATKGIAVLRYEKRTREYGKKLVAEGLGHFTVKEETIDDALSAAAQLRKTDGIDPKRIYILGHSLGGMVAPRIGLADPNLAGLIILAGATRPLEDLMVEQTRYLISLHGQPTAPEQAKLDEVLADVAKVKSLTDADASSTNLLQHLPPRYWLDLRAHDPLSAVKTLQQPLLILQGARDYQVTGADFDGWRNALGSHPAVTFKLYPDLNHLFMTGEGKSTPAEYERAGHVAEGAINDIAAWILQGRPNP